MTWEVRLAAAENPPVSEATLLWTDPPFGTGKMQQGTSGRYRDGTDTAYVVDALVAWLPHMAEEGTVVTCCDYRMAPDIAGAMRRAGWVYRGEVIWQFGLGRPRTSWWPVRHNNLLTFTRTPSSGHFDPTAIPRAVRKAPKAGYPGDKPSGSVWDFTMSNTHPDRVGYPNQKPVEIVTPFVLAHTRPGDLVVDPFCGSSTTGVVAVRHGRRYFGADTNPEAVEVSRNRLADAA